MRKGEADIEKNAEHLSYLMETEREYSGLNMENTGWKSAVFLMNKDMKMKNKIDNTILFFRGRKKGEHVERVGEKYVKNINGFGAF